MNLKSFALVGLLAAVPALLQAQTVTYSLPRTTIVVEVDAVQETFYAGPYARFASKYLGIDVEQHDASRVALQEIRILSRLEADPAARYSVDIRGGEDRFMALSSQGLVSFQDKVEAGDYVWRFDPQARYDFASERVTAPTRTPDRYRHGPGSRGGVLRSGENPGNEGPGSREDGPQGP